MEVGDLCKVIKANTHTSCQKGDMVLITRLKLRETINKSIYIEALNLTTKNFHHYHKDSLVIVNKA